MLPEQFFKHWPPPRYFPHRTQVANTLLPEYLEAKKEGRPFSFFLYVSGWQTYNM